MNQVKLHNFKNVLTTKNFFYPLKRCVDVELHKQFSIKSAINSMNSFLRRFMQKMFYKIKNIIRKKPAEFLASDLIHYEMVKKHHFSFTKHDRKFLLCFRAILMSCKKFYQNQNPGEVFCV